MKHPLYSDCSARVGSTDAVRRAGTMLAASAAPPGTTMTRAIVIGSVPGWSIVE